MSTHTTGSEPALGFKSSDARGSITQLSNRTQDKDNRVASFADDRFARDTRFYGRPSNCGQGGPRMELTVCGESPTSASSHRRRIKKRNRGHRGGPALPMASARFARTFASASNVPSSSSL